VLRIQDLHVHYGSIPALRGISVDVAEGEIVSVVGPNGAGKSTLMNSIAGEVNPSKGAIEFDGVSLLGNKPESTVRRGVSLVPEGRHIFSSLSVRENLQLGATSRADQSLVEYEFERVLEYFPALRERLDNPAGKLSGGEQQQLAIGRALLSAPRLMLLDEPSLGLAPRVIELVYDILSALNQEGLTVLVVEQSVSRALKVSDRTYVLRTGRIEMAGTQEELRDTAAFGEAYFGFSSSGTSPT
jgi:branched-chain amino acid transport system ATP-binding protein